MEPGYNGDRAGEGTASECGHPSDEGALQHPQEPTAPARTGVLKIFSRVRRKVPQS